MLIIFDWDGVFVDSFDQLFRLCCIAQNQVGSGRPFVESDFRHIHSLTLADLAHQIGMREELIETFSSNFFNLQKNNSAAVAFFPGIIEAVRHIDKKANLAIVSSNSEWEIDRYLGMTDIRHIFQAIYVGTDKRSKSEKILKIMHDLMEAKNTTFMVGDCRSDIYQGKKAGVKTVAVTWGYQSRETLLLEEPEFMADTIPEFVKIFDDF